MDMTKQVFLGARVSSVTEKLINDAVDAGHYLNKSDFLRACVSRELDRIRKE